MKKIGLFLLLFAASAMVLSSCNNGNDNGEPIYGKIEFGGETFEINMAECLDISSMPSWEYKYLDYLLLGNVSKGKNQSTPKINCYLGLTIGNPLIDFESIISRFSLISLSVDEINYSTSKLPYHPDVPEEIDFVGIKSLSIDPATGKPYVEEIGDDIKIITGGGIKWTAGEKSAQFEFDLTLEGGKTVKGNATIPYSVFEESRY